MKKILLILISAVFTAAAFLFPSLSWIAYFSLIPVFILLLTNKDKTKNLFLYGWLFGFLFYAGSMHWFLQLHPLDFLDLSGTVSLTVVILGWLLLSLYEGLFTGFLFVLFQKLSVGGYRDLFTLPLLWIVMEWLQGLGVLGFPFCRLYITQYQNLPVIQSVSLFGSLFISLLIAFINTFIASLIVNRELRKTGVAVSTLAFFLINYGYGLIQLHQPIDGKQLKVALIQGNTSSNQKWEAGTTSAIFDTYYRLTKQALEEAKPDLVVLPETILPVTFNDTAYLEAFQSLAVETKTSLAIGGFYYDGPKKLDYNSIYYIDRDGQVCSPLYSKQKLVPFGEFLPFREVLGKVLPILNNINAAGSDLEPGKESSVNHLPSLGTIGSLVCFDSIFPQVARESVNNGAELFCLATNDSWFRDSAGVYQHNAHAVFRALENGRWVTRAANTGISAFLSPRGEIINALAPLTSGYTVCEVSLLSSETLYSKMGELPVYAAVIYLLLMGKEKLWKTYSSKLRPSR